jgi:hypothetical protein
MGKKAGGSGGAKAEIRPRFDDSDSSQYKWWKFVGVSAIVLGFVALYAHQKLYTVPDLPQLDRDAWWGPGQKPKTVDESIRPFTIDVSAQVMNYTDAFFFSSNLLIISIGKNLDGV